MPLTSNVPLDGQIARRKGRGADETRSNLIDVAADGAISFKAGKSDTDIINALIDVCMVDLGRRRMESFTNILPITYKEIKAIETHNFVFRNREDSIHLLQKLRAFFNGHQPPFADKLYKNPAKPEDNLSSPEALAMAAKMDELYNMIYEADGTPKTLPSDAATFDALTSKLKELCTSIVVACHASVREEVDEGLDFNFDVVVDPPEPPTEYTFGRMSGKNVGKKSVANRLFNDPAEAAVPLRDVEFAVVANYVVGNGPKSIMTKSRKDTWGTSKAIAEPQHLSNSELVYDNKINVVLRSATEHEVQRESHIDATMKSAFTISQGTPFDPIVLKVTDSIINSDRTVRYQHESEVSDESVNHALFQAGLMKTSEALVGTKIDHRFVTIQKRDAGGNLINDPNDAQMYSILNGAITAIQSGIIPRFDDELLANLNAKLGEGAVARGGITAGMIGSFEFIRNVQNLAAGKTTDDMKAAYEAIIDSPLVSNEAKAKMRAHL